MKKKLPFSKLVVILVVIISAVFIGFVCYEMHRLNNLDPVGYIGTSVAGLLTVVVTAYMSRAKKQGEFDLELAKMDKIVELQKENPDIDLSNLINNSNNYYGYGGYGGYEENSEGY